MRRTLVSRKARRKRIAENAEMSGENYYNKRVAEIATTGLPRAESPPPLSGRSLSPQLEKSANFGTSFDLKPTASLDDRTPLNPSNSNPSARNGNVGAMGFADPGRATPSRVSPPRDQYGNIIPPNLRRQYSNESQGSNQSNQYYARGGRGGYPPNRGGYPPRGGPQMRGGPGGMRGPPGPPPPGWNGNGRGRGGMMGPPMMGRGGPPPPGYGQDRYGGGPGSRNQSPAPYGTPRGMSPAGMMRDDPQSIGQAVELDEQNGGIQSPTRQEMQGE
jgi:hypothetical protein